MNSNQETIPLESSTTQGGRSDDATTQVETLQANTPPHPHFNNIVSCGSSNGVGDGPKPKDTILREGDCDPEDLACGFSESRKWWIITVICKLDPFWRLMITEYLSLVWVQVSLNFNTSLYSNAVKDISSTYQVSEQVSRLGAMIFLVLYAFGCELWAPFSEEFGRKPTLQLSLFLVNL